MNAANEFTIENIPRNTSEHGLAALLHARGIRVTIGSKHLLEGVDLAVYPGCVTALLGPNGAGKSTLLKTMAGSLTPTAGTVHLDGRPLHEWDPTACARRRAVLTQETHLPFAFTVRDVAMMGRYPHSRHHETARDQRIVAHCLEASDTSALSDRLFPTLSGGEKQRTHWARVLAQLNVGATDLPDQTLSGLCILLDEPTSSLDLGHQHTMLDRARRLAEAGAGVLIVLHDLNLAAHYADTIAMLFEGRIVAVGSPTEVITTNTLKRVYGIDAGVYPHPDNGKPQIYVRMAPTIHRAATRPLPPPIHQPVTA